MSQRPEQDGIEPQLEQEGVIEAAVEPDGKTLHIAFDPDRMTDEKAVLLARQLQSPSEPRFRRSPLRLKGHACEAAADRLAKKERLNGVRRATASFNAGMMSITFDDAVLPPEELLTTIMAMIAIIIMTTTTWTRTNTPAPMPPRCRTT